MEEKILVQRIRHTIEKADMMNESCLQHRFYLKKYGDKLSLVFAKKTKRGWEVECAEWMVKVKK
jgi:hypothetical protein